MDYLIHNSKTDKKPENVELFIKSLKLGNLKLRYCSLKPETENDQNINEKGQSGKYLFLVFIITEVRGVQATN